MTVVIGEFENVGPGGWTVITPSVSSRRIYVDPSAAGGGDGSIATPYNTLAAGFAQMRSGFPDHLYIRQNRTINIDVRVSNPFDVWQTKPGLSASEPTLISTYGPGADAANPRGTTQEVPPIIDFDDANGNSAGIILFPDYSALIGLTVRTPKSDITHPSWILNGPWHSIGPKTFNHWILMEDCAFLGNVGGFSTDQGEARMRRCKVVSPRNYGPYGLRVTYALYEENFLYHCGWAPIAWGGTRGNAHNAYGQASENNETWISRGIMTAWGAYDALKQRHGGAITRNVCWQSGEFIDAGGVAGGDLVPGSGSNQCDFSENIVIEQGGSGTAISQGISIQDMGLSPRTTTVSNNIFAHFYGTTGASLTANTYSHDVTGTNNIAVNARGLSNTGSGNSIAPLITSIEGMLDPTRKIADYMTSIGLTPGPIWEYDDDPLVQAIINNRAYNYDERYTAKAMREYFFDGYAVRYRRLRMNCAA